VNQGSQEQARDTMDLKIGLKIGSIELDFEGSVEMFETKFEAVFNDLLEFGKAKFDATPIEQPSIKRSQDLPTAVSAMTVKAIATKVGADSGGGLLYAAAASLAVIKKKETFSRQEILDEMKLAIGYYKQTYSGNLTGYLEALSKKGIIIETSKDVYVVKEAALTEMERKLAQ
jgi:hypothetical protein